MFLSDYVLLHLKCLTVPQGFFFILVIYCKVGFMAMTQKIVVTQLFTAVPLHQMYLFTFDQNDQSVQSTAG